MGITLPIEKGEMIDRYLLRDEVGQGGMATVFCGEDTVLKREVAVKILHPHLAKDPMHRERFRGEAQAVARLHHPGIVKIYDLSFENDESKPAYIVMEFVDGRTLQDFLEEGEFPLCELAACLVASVLPALEHAHQQNIIHRDLKPENVLLQSNGMPKLADFGLARILDTESITRTGTILGSPAYMAPEQIEGRPGDKRTDLFALGVILYRLACRKHPFQSSNPVATMQAVATSKYTDPELARPGIGRELTRIIRRAIARQPADRYSSVDEFRHDLLQYLIESGLEQPEAILRSYLINPKGTEPQIKQRIITQLKKRASTLISENRYAAALDRCNRVLALAPQDEEIDALVERISNRDHWLQRFRIFGIAAAVILLVGLGWWGIQTIFPTQPHGKPPKRNTSPLAKGADGGVNDTPPSTRKQTPKRTTPPTKRRNLPTPVRVIERQTLRLRIRRAWITLPIFDAKFMYRCRYGRRTKRFFLQVREAKGRGFVRMGKNGAVEPIPGKRGIRQYRLEGKEPFTLHYYRDQKQLKQGVFTLFLPPPVRVKRPQPPERRVEVVKIYPKRKIGIFVSPWAYVHIENEDGAFLRRGRSREKIHYRVSSAPKGRLVRVRLENPFAIPTTRYIRLRVYTDKSKPIEAQLRRNGPFRPYPLKDPMIRISLKIGAAPAKLKVRSRFENTSVRVGGLLLGKVGTTFKEIKVPWRWGRNRKEVSVFVELFNTHYRWEQRIRIRQAETYELGTVDIRKGTKRTPRSGNKE